MGNEKRSLVSKKMNTVIISGRLTADVELRYTQSGTAIGQFNIAVNRKWKDQSGELKEEVSFIGITTFGKQSETVAQYFKKGSPILVQGRLKQESWEDKQTQQKRSKTVVVMENFEFMEGKGNGQQSAPSARPPTADVPLTGSSPANPPVEEDDVPF
jgi:single-strand DNA-binding protein